MNSGKKKQPSNPMRHTRTAMSEKQFCSLISQVKQGVVVPKITTSPQRNTTSHSVLKRITIKGNHVLSRKQKDDIKKFAVYPVRIMNEQSQTLKTVYLSKTQFREVYAVIQRPVEDVEPATSAETGTPKEKGKASE